MKLEMKARRRLSDIETIVKSFLIPNSSSLNARECWKGFEKCAVFVTD